MPQQAPKRIYFDLLDTVRTSERPEEMARSEEPHLPVGQLMLSILCGEIPVFAQNQSMDSSILLKMASASGRAHFLDLVANGYIRFHLFKEPTIMEAFKSALKGNFHFSAWPEIDGQNDSPKVEREAVLDLINKKSPSGIPDSVTERIESLRALSEAQSEAARKIYPEDGAIGYETTALTEEIESAIAASQRHPAETRLALEVEETLIMIPNSRGRKLNRSGWYEGIDQIFSVPRYVSEAGSNAYEQFWRAMEARSVVDLCYNNLVAENLGIEREVFTAKKSKAIRAIQKVISPRAVSDEILEGGSISGLSQMSWEDVYNFRVQLDSAIDENAKLEIIRERVAKKIALIRIKSDWKLVLIPWLGSAATAPVAPVVSEIAKGIGCDEMTSRVIGNMVSEFVKKAIPNKDSLTERLIKQ